MNNFKEDNVLSYKELGYMVGKYTDRNPLSRFLVENFYRTIGRIVTEFEPTGRILEVGCGAGISSLRIQRMIRGRPFEVSDVDGNIIHQFEKIGFPIPFRQESVLKLQRERGEFELVFLLEVLEHVPEFRMALSELFRVSNKYVVVSTPNEPLWRVLNMARGKYWADWGNTPGHVNHWSRSTLADLIGEYGDIARVYTPLPWTIVVARVRVNHS